MIKKLILFILLLTTTAVTATHWELTYVTSLIYPIGISPDGDLLCWTRFDSNSSGGAYLSPVFYGWLIIHADGRWEQISYKAIGDDTGMYNDDYTQYDSLIRETEILLRKGLDADPLPVTIRQLVYF